MLYLRLAEARSRKMPAARSCDNAVQPTLANKFTKIEMHPASTIRAWLETLDAKHAKAPSTLSCTTSVETFSSLTKIPTPPASTVASKLPCSPVHKLCKVFAALAIALRSELLNIARSRGMAPKAPIKRLCSVLSKARFCNVSDALVFSVMSPSPSMPTRGRTPPAATTAKRLSAEFATFFTMPTAAARSSATRVVFSNSITATRPPSRMISACTCTLIASAWSAPAASSLTCGEPSLSIATRAGMAPEAATWARILALDRASSCSAATTAMCEGRLHSAYTATMGLTPPAAASVTLFFFANFWSNSFPSAFVSAAMDSSGSNFWRQDSPLSSNRATCLCTLSLTRSLTAAAALSRTPASSAESSADNRGSPPASTIAAWFCSLSFAMFRSTAAAFSHSPAISDASKANILSMPPAWMMAIWLGRLSLANLFKTIKAVSHNAPPSEANIAMSVSIPTRSAMAAWFCAESLTRRNSKSEAFCRTSSDSATSMPSNMEVAPASIAASWL
mmetsp:Transcript_163498/g.524223  ORF Transcript_163498/g.524223 Transcript_163498/m.524223 type:complete len:507 (-) Transcript_163498:1267-2787(-)